MKHIVDECPNLGWYWAQTVSKLMKVMVVCKLVEDVSLFFNWLIC